MTKKIVTYYYEIGTQIYLSFSAFDMLFHCKFILLSISWRPVLVVEEAGVPGENHRPWASNW